MPENKPPRSVCAQKSPDYDRLGHLADIMSLLRDPERGCPWDIKQDFSTIIPYTIEEVYEVLDAIENNDTESLCDELGDLLFQVVYHSQMASEKGLFDLNEVAKKSCEKMVRRHPHIFGDTPRDDWAAAKGVWEDQKAKERENSKRKGTLDGVAKALPALLRAYKLQSRAARVGFDWTRAKEVIDKIEEEIGELREEITKFEEIGDDDRNGLEGEMGDLLFACANLSRKLGVDPERALRRTNRKFEHRFGYIEQELEKANTKPENVTLDEMEELWQAAKTKAGPIKCT